MAVLKHNVPGIIRQFAILGEFRGGEPYGKGHINDTYCVVFDQAGARVRYILQRINHAVFRNPTALMENVQRVTTHLAARVAGEQDATRRVLSLVPTCDGRAWYVDAAGNYWRVYLFIEGARTFEAAQSPQQAFEAARAFGCFQKMLADMPSPRLHETVPDFHNTPKRFSALEQALLKDAVGRSSQARAEIEFALTRKGQVGLLLDAGLPERVTHNDTKFNNVMLDDATGQGICVIDLDTVMPGLVVYDFGDMVRTATSPAEEDERDLSKVKMQFPMFEALVRGYLSAARDFLTEAEVHHLALAGKTITFEIGLRFLTDFLEGDLYFKVHREAHNLDRCRTQFRLVESIEDQEERMSALVDAIAKEAGGTVSNTRHNAG